MGALEKKVARIIEQVGRDGDRAILRLTKRFDRASIALSRIRVSEAEMQKALRETGRGFARFIGSVARNIAAYHRRQLPRKKVFTNSHGATVGWFYIPVDRVGVYLPGGTAPLISTALATIVPAKIAGVDQIVAATPPDKNGEINPFILATCHLLGADVVIRAGGAQAIAAMALGTQRVPKVDVIVGPGNRYVTEAKRQLYGKVGIDMTAGPSEVAIVADLTVDPSFIAADLLAQAEHANGIAVLFSPSGRLIADVRKEFLKQLMLLNKREILPPTTRKAVRFVKCRNLEDAVWRVNRMAPEHLEILTAEPDKLLPLVRNAGAVFAGRFTATALGDYVAGPSHVLPTGGTSRFFSVLAVDNFFRRVSYTRYSAAAARKACKAVERLATLEGLGAHARSVRIRLEKK